MDDIKSMIKESKVSSEYINLTNYYSSKSIFSIIGDDRSEKIHSNFLAWLLNPQEEHGLGSFPIKSFLLLLSTAKTKRNGINKDCRLSESFEQSFLTETYKIYNISVEREYPTGQIIKGRESGKNNKGYIDILVKIDIEIDSKRKILPVIIENKVRSKENNYQSTARCQQTELYFEWGEKEYGNKEGYFQPVYVFLTVSGDRAAQSGYININYQDMVDNVLSPCMIKKPTDTGVYHIKQYLRCLSYSNLEEDNKKDCVMAFTNEEKTMMRKFFEANKPLFISIANCLKDDEEMTNEDRRTLDAFVTVVNKDYSRYSFNGNNYGKSRLVLAVVSRYCEENPNISFNDLHETFPDTIQGTNLGVVRLEEKISRKLISKYNGSGTTSPRYFINEPIILSSGEKVLICNQWGYNYAKNEGNFELFLEKARQLGYEIKKV